MSRYVHTESSLPEPPAGPRAYHSCLSVGKRQVLSIGGLGNVNMETLIKDKDLAPQGLLVFDMTAMKCVDSYNATLGDYERPDVIRSWYSKEMLDQVAWDSETVKRMFLKQSLLEGGRDKVDTGEFSGRRVICKNINRS